MVLQWCGELVKRCVRRKVFTDQDLQTSELKRCLTTVDLIGLGVGSTLGSGVYILTGQVARETAGPAVVLSFVIAGIASAMAGLCYAEFAARVPRAGSAYVYSYVTVGELMAFVIGWNLILEYVIGVASVARAWSAYFDSLLDKSMEQFFRHHLPLNTAGLSAYPDFLAFGVTLAITVLLVVGVKESTALNNVLVCINLLVILYVVICGLFKADLANWTLSGPQVPESDAGTGGFLPFGVSGMMSGAATCFYAYVGFDCIATTGEETKDPQKSIPVSIGVVLVVVSGAYCGVGAIVTLMCPYFLLDTQAPLTFVFDRLHWHVATYVVTAGALSGLSTSLFGSIFPLPRVLYAMASDGLIFRFLGTINDRFHTPVWGTVLSGLLAGLMAMLFDLEQLVAMMSIGTLLAYTLVSVCVLLLRYEPEVSVPQPTSGPRRPVANGVDNGGREAWREGEGGGCCCSAVCGGGGGVPTKRSSRLVKASVTLMCVSLAALSAVPTFMGVNGQWYSVTLLAVPALTTLLCLGLIRRQPQNHSPLKFKVPLVPYVPAMSCAINLYLILQLSTVTWLRFGIWMAIGFSIYFFYGVRQSGQSGDVDDERHSLVDSGKQRSQDSYTTCPTSQHPHSHPPSSPTPRPHPHSHPNPHPYPDLDSDVDVKEENLQESVH